MCRSTPRPGSLTALRDNFADTISRKGKWFLWNASCPFHGTRSGRLDATLFVTLITPNLDLHFCRKPVACTLSPHYERTKSTISFRIHFFCGGHLSAHAARLPGGVGIYGGGDGFCVQ